VSEERLKNAENLVKITVSFVHSSMFEIRFNLNETNELV